MEIKKILNTQLILYMLVGAAATGVDTALFALLIYYYAFDYRLALMIAFSIGVLINFILCDMYIFDRGSRSFFFACMRHYGASLTGLFLNQIGMIILVSGFKMNYLILGRIIVATCTFFVNFLLIKKFVF